MNRIETCLKQLQARQAKMLSPYITAGDPEPALTLPLLHALAEAGADIIELGIPFSDPMAEGPVIQAAMERALRQQVTPALVLEQVRAFRQDNQHTPIVLMGYVNPIEQYGYEAFACDAVAAGVDGTIIVDMPPEESEDLAGLWQAAGLLPIFLCSPTTTAERMQHINDMGRGYLYYVSLKGVTGAAATEMGLLKSQYTERKAQSQLPLMVGFGIKTPAMAAEVSRFADGVIVGAALINAMQEAADPVTAAADLIRAMRQAIDEDNQ